jgi:hypothetical protein
MSNVKNKRDVNKWEQEASDNPETKGALHKQLGILEDETIPIELLRDILATPVGGLTHGHEVTHLLKARANAALNAHNARQK